MSVVNEYSIISKIFISHEFYNIGLLPITLIPNCKTELYFKRKDLILKRDNNCWVLLGRKNTVLEDFTLKVKPLEDRFYYVTNFDKLSNEEITYNKDGICLIINSSNVANNIDISFTTRYKYFEYIFFAKKIQNKNLSLVDESIYNRVEFHEKKLINWTDDDKVVQFISVNKIKLLKSNSFKIKLIEVLENGHRILLNDLDNPSPMSSALNIKECITVFINCN